MNNFWMEELALVEAAALRIHSQEAQAARAFDEAHARVKGQSDAGTSLVSREYSLWMAARADTNAAWSRWSTVMDARPPA